MRLSRLELLEERTLLSVFAVTNTNDSGPGSLRQTILDANGSAGTDTIEFNIPTGDPNYVDVDSTLPGGDAAPDAFVIRPLSALPNLNDTSGGTTIDGRTQTAFSGDSNPFGPEIVLEGSLAGPANGLWIQSNDNVVFGLCIQGFANRGIFIYGSDNNWLAGNYLGTDATGTIAASNDLGVMIWSGSFNRVGTDGIGINAQEEINIISGNSDIGLCIYDNSHENVVAGNLIGTDAAGTADLENGGYGICITNNSSLNLIGTDGDYFQDAEERNIISGNDANGVYISGTGTDENTVAGNFIGTDVTGTADLGNTENGVEIRAGARFNRIGIKSYGFGNLGERNLISGNDLSGVRIRGADTDWNVVAGNFIGTDVSGTVALGNTHNGVSIEDGASRNVIGTNSDLKADAHEGNVISANGNQGVAIVGTGTDLNAVAGNLIGADLSGTVDIGNTANGVYLSDGAQTNWIGSDGNDMADVYEANTIAFNTLDGVRILGGGSTFNRVWSNSIHSNDGLGIDLNGDGVTANDSSDADTGPNGLQNSPVLTSAVSGPRTTIAGTLSSTPNTSFGIEFFSNTTADPSGFGEGQAYLGWTTVTTDGSGNASFSFVSPTTIPRGRLISATASDPAGSTSEFSASIAVAEFLLTLAGNNLSLLGQTAATDTVDIHMQNPTTLRIGVGAGGFDASSTPHGTNGVTYEGGMIAGATFADVDVGAQFLDTLEFSAWGEETVYLDLEGFSNPGFPSNITIDCGPSERPDYVTIYGTTGSDTFSLSGNTISDGTTTTTLHGVEDLVLYLTRGGDDAVTVDQDFTGALEDFNVVGNGVGDTLTVDSVDTGLQSVAINSNSVEVVERAPRFLEHIEAHFDGEGGATLDGAYSVAVSPDALHVYVASISDDAVSVFSRDATTGELAFIQALEDGDGGVDGLDGANSLTMSPDGLHVYVASDAGDAVAVFCRNATTGELSFVQVIKDTDPGIDGLGGAVSVTVSLDGLHVYAAGYGDDAVAAFSRDSITGELSFIQAIKDGDGGVVDGLDGIYKVTLSPDGRHLYAAGLLDDAIAVFDRNETTGELSFREVTKDGDGGVVDGLDGANSVAVSFDGQYVYVSSGLDDAVAVFSRDGATGELSFVQVVKDGDGGVVDGLEGARSVTVSLDGRHVYAAGSWENAVAVFSRDATTGELNFVEFVRDGLGGVDGLNGPRSPTVSPDGRHIYAVGSADDAVAVFSRDSVTGELSFVEDVEDGHGGIDGLAESHSVTLSPDGLHVYVASFADNAVAVFSRDAAIGELSYVQVVRDGVDGVDGLGGAYSVTVSPDGRQVYATGASDSAVAVFSRDKTTGELSFIEDIRQVGGIDGLDGAYSVKASPDGLHVYVTGQFDRAIAVFSREATTGKLSFVQVIKDTSLVLGLDSPLSVTVSPDGHHVYTASWASDAITAFSRDAATGELSFIQVTRDSDPGIDGLDGANSVTVSPDGRHVYATSSEDNAVTVFYRDWSTGVLSLQEVHFDGIGGVDGLDGANSVTVSLDGQHVYVAGDRDDAVTVFERNSFTGKLALVETWLDGVGGADGLDGAYSVSVSPDGRHVYSVGESDNAVAVFAKASSDIQVGHHSLESVTVNSAGPVVDGNLNLATGTLNLPLLTSPDDFDFDFGTLHFTGSLTVSDTFLTSLLGPVTALSPGQHLSVGLTTTLQTGFDLGTGTFSTGKLVNPRLLDLAGGTFNLTNSNLTVGTGGLFGSTLQIDSGVTVNVSRTTTVGAGGLLIASGGSFSSAEGIANNGEIFLDGLTSQVGGSTLTNSGLIRGTGTTGTSLTNTSAGEVRVAASDRLVFTGAASVNSGHVEAIGTAGAPAEIEFHGPLTNAASTGLIVGRNGILRFGGGLTNDGSLGLSFGTSDVFGDLNNTGTGSIVVSGNSDATFYDDLLNNGTVQVSTGSTAVYFGDVSGGGSFPGGGTNLFEGDLRPGNSPDRIYFGGDVVFGPSATLEFELAGTLPGQFDVVEVAGQASLNGTLDVVVLPGYVPSPGDRFTVMIVGSREGDFAVKNLPPGFVARWEGNYLILEYPADFGDAPDTGVGTGTGNYSTLSSDDGPSHLIVAGLQMGTALDDEAEATQSAAADGDDNAGIDDEDGLVDPLRDLTLNVGLAPSVEVTVTNTTETAATLCGWIDYDGNGVFDNSTERALATVPKGTTASSVTLTFPVVPAGSVASTYARFRLSTDAAGQDSIGAASDGEVEDYRVAIHSQVLARHIFYNNSKWDGHTGLEDGDPAANEFDDAAIATDKTALLPGDPTATFVNYTSYSRGINGIMVDIQGLADPAAIEDADLSEFDFRYGNNDTPGNWEVAAAPKEIKVRDLGGGISRVTFIWDDNAIPTRNWLQTIIKAGPATGLAANDVFYFGNSAGETEGNFVVNYDDLLYSIWPVIFTSAGIESPADINRDGVINYNDLVDLNAWWDNVFKLPPLAEFTPPASLPPSPGLVDSVLSEDLSWAAEVVWFDELYGTSGNSRNESDTGEDAVDGALTMYSEEE